MNYFAYNPFGILKYEEVSKDGMMIWPELVVYQNGKKVSALFTAVSTQASMEAFISRVGGYFANFFYFTLFESLNSSKFFY